MYRSSAVMSVIGSVFVVVVLTMAPGFAAAQKNKVSAPAVPAKSAPSTPAKSPVAAGQKNLNSATQHHTPSLGTQSVQPVSGTAGSAGQHGNNGGKGDSSANGKTGPGDHGTSGGAGGNGGSGNTGNSNSGGHIGPGGKGEGGPATQGSLTGRGHGGPGGSTNGGHGDGTWGRAAGKRFQPPSGSTKKTDGKGGNTYSTTDGKEFHTNAQGKLDSANTPKGNHVKFGANGKPTTIQTKNGTNLTRGEDGSRTVVTMHDHGLRTVSDVHGNGYSERFVRRGGRTYISRTYVVNGRSYARVYNAYYYHGVYFAGYVPAYYYGPAFYGWAYEPWAAPVAWGWGWGASAWYGFYGGYFAPYAAYPGPVFWLTDYLLAANLQAAYAAAQENTDGTTPAPADNDASAVTLTPEAKEAIAAEAKAELAAEKAAAETSSASGSAPQQQVPEALDSKRTVFVVSSTVGGQMDDGQVCSLTGGDVLTRVSNTPDDNQNVRVLVTTAKSNDCAVGTQMTVSVQDLQDMYNAFREKMDAGLGELAKDQGTKKMPKAPGATQRANSAAPAGATDPQATADLKSQQDEAADAEKDVNQTANQATSGFEPLADRLECNGDDHAVMNRFVVAKVGAPGAKTLGASILE